MVEKLEKKLSTRFTTMDNRIAQCNNLSIEAKGLYWYMLSLPNDWDFSIKRIANSINCGYDKAKRIIDELLNIGIVKRRFEHDDNGYKKSIYTILDFDSMQYENPNIENPCMENPNIENPCMENPCNNKEINIQRNKYNKEINIQTFKEPESKDSEPLKDSRESKNLFENEIEPPNFTSKRETKEQKYVNAMQQFRNFKMENPTCCISELEWSKWLKNIIQIKGSKFSYTAQIKQLKKSLTLDEDYVHSQIEKATDALWQGLHFDELDSKRYVRRKTYLDESNKTNSKITKFDTNVSGINPNNEPYPDKNDKEAIIAWNKKRIEEHRKNGDEVEIFDNLYNFGIKF